MLLYNLMIFFLKFAELDFSEIIKLSVQLKNGAYLTEILQISIYPYSPEKVQFSSLIFWVNLIFPTRKLPHKANFTKIIYLSIQINLDKKYTVCETNRTVNRRCSKLVCVQMRVRGKNIVKENSGRRDSQRKSWRGTSHREPECWRFAKANRTSKPQM